VEALWAWVIGNQEWLFSGGGVVLVSWLGRSLFKRMEASSAQTIHSGESSNNVQAGRDVYIGTTKKRNDVE
jgi:hypothetical protein